MLPRCSCPSCAGLGAVMVEDLAQPGESFPVLCSRCGGAGSIPVGFGLAPRAPRPSVEVDEDIKF